MSDMSNEESTEYTVSPLKNDNGPNKNKLFYGKVTLYHGPYEDFNFIGHREDKLRSLKGLLENHGYSVEYLAWDCFNRMGVSVNDKLIFTCRMTNLDFDSFGNDRVFHVIMKFSKRIEAWYLIKHFSDPAPYEYFNQSFG